MALFFCTSLTAVSVTVAGGLEMSIRAKSKEQNTECYMFSTVEVTISPWMIVVNIEIQACIERVNQCNLNNYVL